MVRVEIRQGNHCHDFTRIHIHHDPGTAFGAVFFDSLAQFIMHNMLETQIDAQAQRFLAGPQPIFQAAFDAR